MSMATDTQVLLVDDEHQVLDSASFALRFAGIAVDTCSDSRHVLQRLAEHPAAVVVLDLLMPFITGKELLPQIRQRFPEIPVIVMTAVNDVETAVELMREGAYDYLVKPVKKEDLVAGVRRALEQWVTTRENSRLRERLLSARLDTPEAFADIVTRSTSMQAIFRYIDAIAATPMPVLVTGETGTGKELIARAVHQASGRKGPFVAVNVAGLDDTLFSDTLFGHVKGAFTGAQGERKGLIASAESGTLFLDEIGDLSLESQVKLLRLLEDRTFFPVGSDRAHISTARIITATNRTIEQLRDDENFRADLYYRLRTHHVHIPPLRERKEDLPLLAAHFLMTAAEEMGREVPTVPEQLNSLLATYHFPGNIRELKALLCDAVGRHQGGVLSLESIRRAIIDTPASPSGAARYQPESGPSVHFTEVLPSLKEMETMLIDEAMRRAQGNQTVAARMLGFTRTALNKRLNKRT
jgi:DNA-binding NtrC family response regulator